jgi:type III restriction enzyme
MAVSIDRRSSPCPNDHTISPISPSRKSQPRPISSFWLQTPSDRFYPDFVARLSDSRILVVEYKGADRWSNDDSKEKRNIGQLWAARSNGRCVFIMPKGPDWPALSAAIGS